MNLRSILSALCLVSSLSLFAGCGGSGSIGEACDGVGSAENCEDNAICHDRDSPDSPGTCRLICNSDTDCPDNGSCEDVEDSDFKGCIPVD
ncbi:MAG: hypothetical protein DRJ42_05060 [Deltaproteobacteria bacterium]|nr:MAG: hypothetical protein DRJ42_05060 [Deltaproteobacteria bacterium]